MNRYIILNHRCYLDEKALYTGFRPHKMEKSFHRYRTLPDDFQELPKVKLDTVLFFWNEYDKNFSHFFKETFPLLTYIFKDIFKVKGFKILVEEKPKYKGKLFKSEILQILNLGSYLVPMKKDHIYTCNNIIYSQKKEVKKMIKVTLYPRLLETLIKNSKKMSTLNSFNQMIYLSREEIDSICKKRWVSNQAEVSKLIKKYGFVTTTVDNYHFWDQVTIINNADKIITLIGANCENILFSKKESLFSIIFSPKELGGWVNEFSYRHFLNSYNPIQCSYRDMNYEIPEVRLNGCFLVDLNELERCLKIIVKNKQT